jgi:hypothetical protein
MKKIRQEKKSKMLFGMPVGECGNIRTDWMCIAVSRD